MSSFKAGQILEDIRIYGSQYGSHTFATVIEDVDSIDLDDGFTVQGTDLETLACPCCGKLPDIRLMAVSCLTGQRELCLYCVQCHLLYRSAVIGSTDWQGNYLPNKDYE